MKWLPWWGRIAGKIVLARLPVPYSWWRRVGLFRHGEMNRPERAIKTFETYFLRAMSHGVIPSDFTCLEVGPGDSALTAIVARAYGAKESWLVDAGEFAQTDVAACRETARIMRERGFPISDLANADNLNAVLRCVSANYLTQGTQSLSFIPDGSVDFFWSQVVLEHVARNDLPLFLQQLRRVVTDKALGIHSIDFRDHLGGGLNHLRLSGRVWESPLFHNSGFYTNRLRPREIITHFERAGFSVETIGETPWPSLALPRHKMASCFQHLEDDDFMIAEMEILVRPKSLSPGDAEK